MPPPSKEVDLEIAIKEKFKVNKTGYYDEQKEEIFLSEPCYEDIKRVVALPWWIMLLLNEAIALSRKCDVLDKRPSSIRGSYRSLDHTYAGAELENRKIAHLKDAYHGLRLSLRGRIELKPDLIDFDHPADSFNRSAEFTEDLLAVAFGNYANFVLKGCNTAKLAVDLKNLSSKGIKNITHQLENHMELKQAVTRLQSIANEKINRSLLNETEIKLFQHPDSLGKEVLLQYNFSAVETIFNAAAHSGLIK